jgi:hypothetical protein
MTSAAILKVRLSPATGEIDVAMDSESARELVEALRAGRGTLRGDTTGNAAPFEGFLGRIVVRSGEPGKVRLAPDSPAGALIISGDRSRLNILADNVEALSRTSSSAGDHLHVEYFPDHFYLAENSAPVVFRVMN